MPDAIVIGSGPNGLVAANHLAEAGWSVTVFEAADRPGGSVQSEELMEQGFVNDLRSAFYPLGAGSPVMKALELEKYGLVWKRSPLVLAHPATDGTCAVIADNLDDTVASLNAIHDGDGDRWAELFALWERTGEGVLGALFSPFPPVRAGVKLARTMPPKDLLRFARFGVLPVRNLGDEYFHSPAAKRLLAGLALHADLLPESNLSGFFGWFLGSVGQQVGFPVPEGGASGLTDALVRRLEAFGGTVECGVNVQRILAKNGKAFGVQCVDGTKHFASRAVLADVNAVMLYRHLVPETELPGTVKRDIERFTWDSGTVKLDWNLDRPIPWTAPDARRAGTVHLTESVDELSATASELARGLVPKDPFLLFGQQSMTDPSRMPQGKETAWAYTHVPIDIRGDAGGQNLSNAWGPHETEVFADRMESKIEALAPGFRDLIRQRNVETPPTLEAGNANLYRGAINAGTAALHQELVFRPIPGLGRAETPIQNLYLASASAHPGGGVHGACGANAAKAALAHWRHKRVSTLFHRVSRRADRAPSVFP